MNGHNQGKRCVHTWAFRGHLPIRLEDSNDSLQRLQLHLAVRALEAIDVVKYTSNKRAMVRQYSHSRNFSLWSNDQRRYQKRPGDGNTLRHRKVFTFLAPVR